MSSSVEDIKKTIDKLILTPNLEWKYSSEGAKKFQSGDKSTLEYWLRNQSKDILGTLTLKFYNTSASLADPGDNDSEYIYVKGFSINLKIVTSVIEGDIEKWIKQCSTSIKALKGEVKVQDGKLRVLVPDILIDVLDEEKPFKDLLSTVIHSQTILNHLYIISKEVIQKATENTYNAASKKTTTIALVTKNNMQSQANNANTTLRTELTFSSEAKLCTPKNRAETGSILQLKATRNEKKYNN